MTILKASSCKTHDVQLRRAEGQEVWRGDRSIGRLSIGLRDWVGEVLVLYLYSGDIANRIHDTSNILNVGDRTYHRYNT